MAKPKLKKWIGVSMAASLLSLPAWSGVARLPLEAPLCWRHDAVERWGYSRSDDVRNGRRDRTGVVELRFAGPGRSTEFLRVPVRGLRWDRGFRELVARGAGGEFLGVCATQTWHGIVKEGRCRLEGRVVPAAGSGDGCGDGAGAYVFQGALVVEAD